MTGSMQNSNPAQYATWPAQNNSLATSLMDAPPATRNFTGVFNVLGPASPMYGMAPQDFAWPTAQNTAANLLLG